MGTMIQLQCVLSRSRNVSSKLIYKVVLKDIIDGANVLLWHELLSYLREKKNQESQTMHTMKYKTDRKVYFPSTDCSGHM